jgi:hypothetical protein
LIEINLEKKTIKGYCTKKELKSEFDRLREALI